ncbi:MAG TPA: hypothetical protein VJ783_28685 [Pirellulales bacterium]|nr:hypothetical protein [Pirellulales bacterium]
MPLRDHFRPPLDDVHSWDELHGMWPATIVCALNEKLPESYVAAPRVHLGVGSRLPEPEAYEVRVYEGRQNRGLVAAIQIVSPSNKDRAETRGAFVSKVTALLAHNVCVSIVDVVSTSNVNLYAEILNSVEHADPALGDHPPPMYAATLRTRFQGRWLMECWYHMLSVGAALPTLPVWLTEGLAVPLDLEATYEEICRILRIR